MLPEPEKRFFHVEQREMRHGLTILVAGRAQQNLEEIAALLRDQTSSNAQVHCLANGTADPFAGIDLRPEILVLDLSSAWEEELQALANHPVKRRPPAVVIGPDDEPQLLLAAMQAGVRDFIARPARPEQLVASVIRLAKDISAETARTHGALSVAMNAKGGSGASFLASNLAHLMVTDLQKKVALLDLDLQFGTLPLYLDLTVRGGGLIEALAASDDLDPMALAGYMTRHRSGLHLLASMSDHVLLPWEISPRDLGRVLDVALQGYDHVIADLPRQIDPLTITLLERADHIVIVLQANLSSLRDTKHLLHILRRELAVGDEQIFVIVNRYQEKNPVKLSDLRQALDIEDPALIPNDFRRVTEAVNLGIPLGESAKHAAITKAMTKIAVRLNGQSTNAQPGLLRKALSLFG